MRDGQDPNVRLTRNTRGFSLLDLMFLVGILGTALGLWLKFNYSDSEESRIARSITAISTLQAAIYSFYANDNYHITPPTDRSRYSFYLPEFENVDLQLGVRRYTLVNGEGKELLIEPNTEAPLGIGVSITTIFGSDNHAEAVAAHFSQSRLLNVANGRKLIVHLPRPSSTQILQRALLLDEDATNAMNRHIPFNEDEGLIEIGESCEFTRGIGLLLTGQLASCQDTESGRKWTTVGPEGGWEPDPCVDGGAGDGSGDGESCEPSDDTSDSEDSHT